MRFGPVEITDKLGRRVILRNAEVSDADDLIRYMKVTVGETPFLIRETDEVCITRELEVISENKHAIALYQMLGFEKYGSFPGSMEYQDGTYADADWMMKRL